ncbi:hypothetical protein, partial [Pseudomonas aeruginosa]
MVDSSSQALVDELNTKRKRLRLWPFVAALTVGAFVLSAKQLPPWALLTLLIIGGLLIAVTYYWDLLRKTTVMLYDIESECSGQPIPDSGLSFSSATAGGNPSLN